MVEKCWALTFGLTVLLGMTGTAQTADPPGTGLFMANYRAWFAAADTNKDGMLDKEELAHAFRGHRAKPYDYVPPAKETKVKGKGKDEKDANEKDKEEKDKEEKDKEEQDKGQKDKAKSEDKPEKDSSSAEKSSTVKPAKKPNYSLYADYNFLVQLDSNNDEQISREEFDNWARDLSVQIKQQLEAQQRALELQARLIREASKLRPGDRRKIETDLRREREQMERLQAQMQKLQKNFNQAKKQSEQSRKR